MTFADLLYKIWAYVWNNKQTWLGSATAGLAFIQAYPQFRDLVEPGTYEWIMFGVGLVMVLFARSSAGGVVSSVMPASIPADRGPPPSAPLPPEGGFIRGWMLAVLLACSVVLVPVTLTGCASIGVQAPETFNEKMAAGYKTVEALADNTTSLLVPGKISSEDAKNVVTQLTTAKEGLDITRQIYDSGDFENANTRLQAIITALTALQAYLIARGD